ncbi:MAG: alpha/beta fold hydrolase [Firmicutes bacterium]|nr:alpha/beta fold hydrolase [Bacillota bacterium]
MRRRAQLAVISTVMLAMLAMVVSSQPSLANAPASPVAPQAPPTTAHLSEFAGQPRPFVLLVHGWLATSLDMLALKLRLTRDGFDCDAIDFSYLGVLDSIADYAGELAWKIEAGYANHRNIAVVAHSMGGLVTRYYLKNLRTTDQVKTVITVAAPHHGTFGGIILPPRSTPTSEMLPDSPFLEELNSVSETPPGVDFHAIWTPTDGVVIPAENSIMCGARNYKVSGLGVTHLGLLMSDSAYAIILDVLRGRKPATTGPQTRDHDEAKKHPLPWLRLLERS